MSLIYQGSNIKTSEKVLVKRAKDSVPGAQHDLQNAIWALRRIAQSRNERIKKHVPQILSEGKNYLVMSQFRGRNLDLRLDFISQRRERKIEFAFKLLNIFFDSHQLGILFIDTSPKNIFLEFQDELSYEVKLVDFGGASEIGKSASYVVADQRYVAPELKIKRDNVERMNLKYHPTMDIYSLGLIFQDIDLAYDENSDSELPNVVQLLKKMTSVDPNKRPRNILEVIEELKTVFPKEEKEDNTSSPVDPRGEVPDETMAEDEKSNFDPHLATDDQFGEILRRVWNYGPDGSPSPASIERREVILKAHNDIVVEIKRYFQTKYSHVNFEQLGISITIAGSSLVGLATEGSDLDIYILIDDTDLDFELKWERDKTVVIVAARKVISRTIDDLGYKIPKHHPIRTQGEKVYLVSRILKNPIRYKNHIGMADAFLVNIGEIEKIRTTILRIILSLEDPNRLWNLIRKRWRSYVNNKHLKRLSVGVEPLDLNLPSLDKMTDYFSDTSLSGEGSDKEGAISSPVGAKKGGIDLNPNNLDLQTQGKSFDFNVPLDFIDLQNIRIDGFTPVIINVAPLTNLPLLLGLVEEPQNTENVRITPGRDPMDHRMEYDEEIAS